MALALQKSAPEQGWSHYAMGKVRLSRGLRNAAKTAFAKAVELDPACYSAYVELAGMELDRKH